MEDLILNPTDFERIAKDQLDMLIGMISATGKPASSFNTLSVLGAMITGVVGETKDKLGDDAAILLIGQFINSGLWPSVAEMFPGRIHITNIGDLHYGDSDSSG